MGYTEMKQIFEIIGQYGLPLCLVVYFIWRDYERDKVVKLEKDKMVLQIDNLNTEIRIILEKLVSHTTAIIVGNAEAMRDFLAVLKIRPCIADELAKKLLQRTEDLIEYETENRQPKS